MFTLFNRLNRRRRLRRIPIYDLGGQSYGGINTRDGWNEATRKLNAAAFARAAGRPAADDREVSAWVRAMTERGEGYVQRIV